MVRISPVFSPNMGKYAPENSEYGHFLRWRYHSKNGDSETHLKILSEDSFSKCNQILFFVQWKELINESIPQTTDGK